MQGDDHADVVASVKAALVGRGVDLTGPCGAFQITKRVAWALRAEGAGLLSKPDGNNCENFAVDIVAYRDGMIVDVLISSGETNGPAWQVTPANPALIARWRPPADPGDVAAPAPAPGATPTPPPAPSDKEAWIDDLLESLDRIADGINGLALGVHALSDRVGSLETNGVRLKLR